MMRKFRLPFILSAMLIVVVACTIIFPNDQVQGSGEIIRQEYTLEAFDRVNLQGFGDVTITIGESQSVWIETDDNLLQYIETRLENETLILGVKQGAPRSLLPTESIRFEVITRNLESVSLSGSGLMEVNTIQGKDFEVNLSGNGDIQLVRVDTERLDLLLSGSGKIDLENTTTLVTNIENSGTGLVEVGTLTSDLLAVLISGSGDCQIGIGEVDRQKIEISGLGSLDSSNLKSNQTDAQISGAGSATVWVESLLDVVISGAGDVKYFGSPQVTVDNSGVGNVESLGPK